MNHVMKYQNALNKVSEVTPLLVGETLNEFKRNSEEFMQEVQDAQYIKVPLVGVFSAGKSSLLNVFTEKVGMLPVDTMPETAVAYELYYGLNESVELYRNGEKIDSKPLADIKQLDTKPGDIAKVYCTSEHIKKLQDRGIILVDMPGIGSGLERHDAAIFNYINSGTAFVLIVDAEQGSLRGSTMTFMQELSQYNMHPAILISKIDKKTDSEVKAIKEYIEYQLSKLGSTDSFVGTVCSVNNDLNGFTTYLESLNPEALVREKLNKKFRYIVNSVIEQINLRIQIKDKDIADVEGKIKQFEAEIANVKLELPVADGYADSPEKSTEDVLDSVRLALSNKATDIAQMIIDKEDSETVKAAIVSIVRSAVILALKDESEQYSVALGAAVKESITELPTFEVTLDFMNDFSGVTESLGALLTTALAKIGVLGGLGTLIINLVVSLVPKFLSWLFGKSNDAAVAEVRQKFISTAIQEVIDGIRPTILKITQDNQKNIQDKIQAELISKMEKVKDSLREKMEDANKSKSEVESEQQELKSALSYLNSIVSEL